MASISPSQTFCLLVLGEQSLATHWLPNDGWVTVGRGMNCNLVIDEASIAPLHARIHVGDDVALEALQANAPLSIQGRSLRLGEKTLVRPGDVVRMGAVNLVLQKRSPTRPRRIWNHGYFDSRLEEECIRGERYASEFALLRLRAPPAVASTSIEDTLANVLRNVDIVANYGPNEYEVLLVDTPPAGAELVRERLIRALQSRELDADIGLASYPRDGRTPDVLSAEAGARVRGEELVSTPSPESALPFGELVERIAASTIGVLLLGETGVGKERLAERVHTLSPRHGKPFLRLNCAALSETLLESELFGHERGSFTGAHAQKPGLLEIASGGTVFLDEVGEMPLSIQAKLLRVIEERKVRRVGGVKDIDVDVRFVAATNRDLEAEIRRGTFRQDLYFRLNGVAVVIPPLRERVEEIPELVKLFVADTCRRNGRAEEPALAPQALSLMRSYSWPGNIRELRNVVERAVILCPSGPISLSHLPIERMSTAFATRNISSPPARLFSEESTLKAPVPPAEIASTLQSGRTREVETYERRRIENALRDCAGNQTEAARRLGISRRTLINRLSRYNMPRPRKKG